MITRPSQTHSFLSDDKFCVSEECIGLMIKADPALLRPLVTNLNGFIEGVHYLRGGPDPVELVDPDKPERVLASMSNSTGLVFSFRGTM